MLAMLGCAKRLPVADCTPLAPWTPGNPLFEEVTGPWGLDGVEGVRLQAVDVDGDGWIDLHVHLGAEDGAGRSTLLRNDGGHGFIDVTAASGLRQRRQGEGERAGSVVVFGDVDGDGDLDVFTGVDDPDGSVDDTSELLLNQGDGTFVLGPDDAPWRAPTGVPAGAVFVDVDRDGWLDLWVPENSVGGMPAQDHLYRNTGQGRFVDATAALGLSTVSWDAADALDALDAGRAHSNAWSANACDLDDDGWPELLAASYGRAPNHLWRNAQGRFTNASVSSGYAFDARQDYTDNQLFRCFCVENPQADRCDEAEPPQVDCRYPWDEPEGRRPFRNGGNSATTSCGDVDHDGDVDLLTGEIQHWWAGAGSDEAQLLINDGSGTFTRPGIEALGLTRELPGERWDKGDMTNTLVDVDADGWLDVFVGSSDYHGTRALLWRQVEPLRFEAVDPEDFFLHRRSHGVVAADFDRDGAMDLVVGHSRARCGGECEPTHQIRMFRGVHRARSLSLDLEGRGPNTHAVGARVRVTAAGTTQTLHVGSGFGHFGAQEPHRLFAGLGGACAAEVEVRWPDGTTSEHRMEAGSWRLEQGGDPQRAGR